MSEIAKRKTLADTFLHRATRILINNQPVHPNNVSISGTRLLTELYWQLRSARKCATTKCFKT